ncbi:MAG: glycosyltransferase [Alphaproteobacteria bacterium]|nr:glycosyltransferase [Alphaproteobacteria bacterium]
MTAPKVLHFHFGTDGGAERFFVNLAKALGERGVEQRFVIRPVRSWRPDIAPLGPIIEHHYRRLSLFSPLLEWRIRRLAREWRPNAIMAWMPRAARLIPDYPGAVKLTRLGDFPRHLDHFARCDLLVGNVPGIAQHCRDLGWSRPVRTISNFPREVQPRPIARQSLDTPIDAFVISNAGRFVNRKGFDLLIRAAARIPGAYLWLIGDGRERAALEQLAEAEGIRSRTRFIGWVEEPIHTIAASDVLVMPSRHEPLGNVILEAWAAGVPVVATRSEGPSWYMIDGENGLLADIDDLDAVVAGIARIRADRALARGLVAGGAAQLQRLFSKERIVEQYLALFAGRIDESGA